MMQPPSQTKQSPLENALNAAFKLGSQALDTASEIKDPALVIDKTLTVGKLILDNNKSVTELDKAVTSLEKAAPGTIKTMTDFGAALESASKLIDPRMVPGGLKPLSKDLQSATKEFAEFSEAYEKYQGKSNWNFFGKMSAGNECQKEWSEFKTSWDKLNTHVPPALKDPAIGDAARKGVDLIRDILKP